MSEVEVFDGKLIGLVAGMTNDSCQLYERKECLKKATICVFKCNFLLGRIYFFLFPGTFWQLVGRCASFPLFCYFPCGYFILVWHLNVLLVMLFLESHS